MEASARRAIDAAIDAYLARVGDAIETDARRFVPVDTGELRDSIHAEVQDGKVVVNADAEHAAYVELGTRDSEAQPFLKPALYRARGIS